MFIGLNIIKHRSSIRAKKLTQTKAEKMEAAFAKLYQSLYTLREGKFNQWLVKSLHHESLSQFLNFIQNEQELLKVVYLHTKGFPAHDFNLAEQETIIASLNHLQFLLSSHTSNDVSFHYQDSALLSIHIEKRTFTLAELKKRIKDLEKILSQVPQFLTDSLNKEIVDNFRLQGINVLYKDIITMFNAYSQAYEDLLVISVQAQEIALDKVAPAIRQTSRARAAVQAQALIANLHIISENRIKLRNSI